MKKVLAPAKINLSLKILGRRPDGYHQLDSLFVPVDLCDELLIDRAGRGISLSCPDSGLPEDETNLAWRAAERFLAAAGTKGGLNITLKKNIPLAAGLGGGSSDAAAVLKAANELYGRPLSFDRLSRLALELGADVPFFIGCRPARAGGVGEILAPLAIDNYHYILLNPGFEVSTARVFRALEKPLTETGPFPTISPVTIDSYKDLLNLENDLQPVVTSLWPVVGELLGRLNRAGAALVRMSGSGPTVFGLFQDRRRREKALAGLKTDRDWRVFAVQGLAEQPD